MSLETASRRVTVILNEAVAAEKRGPPDRLVETFARHNIRADVRLARGRDGITEMAQAAVRNGIYAVVAGGGDGTVSAVASTLVDSECALGVLPLGTLNHFAKDLRIPLDAEKATHTIATGTMRRVDVGEVNGTIFLNNSSLGLYPSMVRGRERAQRLGRSKWVALFWATLAVLRRYPLVSVRLTSGDGQEFLRRTPLVFIGNNQYEMKGLEIGSRPSLDRGELAVYVAHQDGPAALVRMGLEAVLGRIRRGVDFDFLSTERLLIEAARPTMHVANDGEVATFILPLHYRIRPAALRVLAPADH